MFVDSILNELETKDLLRIISIQNKPLQDILNEVKEKFATKELLFFKALATLISSGLLNRSQRVASLMILIKNNIQMVNPFFSVLDQIYQSKELTVESNMVVSMLSEVHVPSEVMKRTVKELVEWYNRPLMFTDLPNTFVEMREAFNKACEEIKKNSAFSGDISNVLQDFSSTNTKTQSPTDSLRYEDLLEQDLQGVAFRPKLLTIIPQEIPLDDEEICWLLPFATDCGQLVQGAESKDLEDSFLDLIRRGTARKLSSQESNFCSQGYFITELATEQPNLLTKSNVFEDNLCLIIQAQNEEMVSFLLIVLEEKNKSLYDKCVELIFQHDWDGEGSALGVAQTLIKNFRLPQTLVDGFLANFWKSIEKEKDSSSSKYNHKLKLIATFMKKLIEGNLFDPKVRLEQWMNFCRNVPFQHSSVQELLKLLSKVADPSKQTEN